MIQKQRCLKQLLDDVLYDVLLICHHKEPPQAVFTAESPSLGLLEMSDARCFLQDLVKAKAKAIPRGDK